jgi:hypothetical protein
MTNATGIALVVSFALAASSVAGCGGDTDATAAPVTKDEFIRRADAICEKADKVQESELKVYLKAHPDGPASRVGRTIKLVGLPPIHAEVEELANLEVPQGEESVVGVVIRGMRQSLREAEEKPGVLATGAGPFTEVDKLAKKYGFKACSSVL